MRSPLKFVPKKKEKEAITSRIPTELLEIIDRKAGENDLSRNDLITQCIEFALSNMDNEP